MFVLPSTDPTDLTYEKMISELDSAIGDNISLTKNLIFILDLRSPCYAKISLRFQSFIDKEPDVKKSPRGPEFAAGSLTASVLPERT
ncbi:unnamed protein product [Hymenolepis diminuta]|uniref:Uncharacterized protein n=1 Tax=Hymenolepis diminuta TaxID=6216 RepID=A0A564XX70_HYMDI|nr:unnamed protein product [Hymenolepis diminuta]